MKIFDIFQLFKSFQFYDRTKQQQNPFRIPNTKIAKPSGFLMLRIPRINFIRILEEFLEEMSSVMVQNNYKRHCFYQQAISDALITITTCWSQSPIF